MAAREYAIRECGDCGAQVPANETVRITQKVLAGTHSSARLYRGTRGGIGVGGSSGSSYRYVERDLCGECVAIRAATMRRARRGRFFGIMIVLAMVIGGVFALSMRGSIESAAPATDRPAAQSDGLTGEAAHAAPQAEPSPAPEVDSAPASPAAPRGQTPEPAPTEAASAADDARQAILGATPRALDKGEPERWKAGDLKGYVVPSEAQDDGERTCRNIYATTIHGQDQEQGAAARWCRPIGGGDWSPQ